jgi:pimeloyl-ACP methyl ester carboxylesterase
VLANIALSLPVKTLTLSAIDTSEGAEQLIDISEYCHPGRLEPDCHHVDARAVRRAFASSRLLAAGTGEFEMTKASNVILVHGAWADGSSWSKVIPLLLGGGLSVTAVQLPLMSLKDDVATVKRAIALEDGPIILVGHSYGGVVITEAGDDPKVAGLVYIAAFAPDVGQSVGSLGASVEPAPMGAEVRPDAQGFLRLTEAGVKNDFAQDLTPAEKSILFAAQAPTAAAAFGESVSVASWKAKPSWYLVATADRAIQPSLERAMAKAINAKTVEIASSHVAMLARPEETANLILEAAGRASRSMWD